MQIYLYFFKIYEVRVLYFRESIATGTRYFYDTPWLRTDSVPILFFIFFATATRVVLLWYARGTQIQKNAIFFPFFLFAFLFI
jgi:hypothetical protein